MCTNSPELQLHRNPTREVGRYWESAFVHDISTTHSRSEALGRCDGKSKGTMESALIKVRWWTNL